jgi:hypothetical protein
MPKRKSTTAGEMCQRAEDPIAIVAEMRTFRWALARSVRGWFNDEKNHKLTAAAVPYTGLILSEMRSLLDKLEEKLKG